MLNELVDATSSLTALVEEENTLLAVAGASGSIGSLVDAKVRLSGIIAREMVRLDDPCRRSMVAPEWLATFGTALERLLAELDTNAALLKRRIALCDDLMGAITTEARRAVGGQSATYGAGGRLATRRDAAPIAINSRL